MHNSVAISIVYQSSSRILPGSNGYYAAMAGLLVQCFDNNMLSGITGAVVLTAGRFVQVLEGPREAVQATFARIVVDPRHHGIEVLSEIGIDHRHFAEWSMAFIGPPTDIRSILEVLDRPYTEPAERHHALIAAMVPRVNL